MAGKYVWAICVFHLCAAAAEPSAADSVDLMQVPKPSPTNLTSHKKGKTETTALTKVNSSMPPQGQVNSDYCYWLRKECKNGDVKAAKVTEYQRSPYALLEVDKPGKMQSKGDKDEVGNIALMKTISSKQGDKHEVGNTALMKAMSSKQKGACLDFCERCNGDTQIDGSREERLAPPPHSRGRGRGRARAGPRAIRRRRPYMSTSADLPGGRGYSYRYEKWRSPKAGKGGDKKERKDRDGGVNKRALSGRGAALAKSDATEKQKNEANDEANDEEEEGEEDEEEEQDDAAFFTSICDNDESVWVTDYVNAMVNKPEGHPDA